MGVKIRIPSAKAMHIHIPYYDGLTIEKIMGFAAQCKEGVALKYLPSDKLDLAKLPRQYVANVVYTICEGEFSDWVSMIIEAHNEKMAMEGN